MIFPPPAPTPARLTVLFTLSALSIPSTLDVYLFCSNLLEKGRLSDYYSMDFRLCLSFFGRFLCSLPAVCYNGKITDRPRKARAAGNEGYAGGFRSGRSGNRPPFAGGFAGAAGIRGRRIGNGEGRQGAARPGPYPCVFRPPPACGASGPMGDVPPGPGLPPGMVHRVRRANGGGHALHARMKPGRAGAFRGRPPRRRGRRRAGQGMPGAPALIGRAGRPL